MSAINLLHSGLHIARNRYATFVNSAIEHRYLIKENISYWSLVCPIKDFTTTACKSSHLALHLLYIMFNSLTTTMISIFDILHASKLLRYWGLKKSLFLRLHTSTRLWRFHCSGDTTVLPRSNYLSTVGIKELTSIKLSHSSYHATFSHQYRNWCGSI